MTLVPTSRQWLVILALIVVNNIVCVGHAKMLDPQGRRIKHFAFGIPAVLVAHEYYRLGVKECDYHAKWSAIPLNLAWPYILVMGVVNVRRSILPVKHVPGTCRACGYDVRGSGEVCPECGNEIEP